MTATEPPFKGWIEIKRTGTKRTLRYVTVPKNVGMHLKVCDHTLKFVNVP
jgi:hypothetical protein